MVLQHKWISILKCWCTSTVSFCPVIERKIRLFTIEERELIFLSYTQKTISFRFTTLNINCTNTKMQLFTKHLRTACNRYIKTLASFEKYLRAAPPYKRNAMKNIRLLFCLNSGKSVIYLFLVHL